MDKKERMKAWREANAERIKERNAQYREEHREELRAKGRAYSAATREKRKAEYLNNPEPKRERARKWAQDNAEKARAKSKQWREDNPERYREQMRRARQRHRARRANLTSYLVTQSDINRILSRPCAVAGCVNTDMTLDHVIPLARGGTHGVGNLQPLCGWHNSVKGARLWIEFRRALAA